MGMLYDPVKIYSQKPLAAPLEVCGIEERKSARIHARAVVDSLNASLKTASNERNIAPTRTIRTPLDRNFLRRLTDTAQNTLLDAMRAIRDDIKIEPNVRAAVAAKLCERDIPLASDVVAMKKLRDDPTFPKISRAFLGAHLFQERTKIAFCPQEVVLNEKVMLEKVIDEKIVNKTEENPPIESGSDTKNLSPEGASGAVTRSGIFSSVQVHPEEPEAQKLVEYFDKYKLKNFDPSKKFELKFDDKDGNRKYMITQDVSKPIIFDLTKLENASSEIQRYLNGIMVTEFQKLLPAEEFQKIFENGRSHEGANQHEALIFTAEQETTKPCAFSVSTPSGSRVATLTESNAVGSFIRRHFLHPRSFENDLFVKQWGRSYRGEVSSSVMEEAFALTPERTHAPERLGTQGHGGNAR